MIRTIFLAIVLALPGQVLAGSCADDRVDIRGNFGSVRFHVEVADDDGERAQGLMNRPSMPRFSGMLFIYPHPTHARFWMRNTLIPLDMLFVGTDGVIRRIHDNAVPLDETTIDGGGGVVAVLEINGGLAATLGIRPGDQLRHPAFGDGALWGCDG